MVVLKSLLFPLFGALALLAGSLVVMNHSPGAELSEYEKARQYALAHQLHFVALVGDVAQPWNFPNDVVSIHITRAEWVRINRVYPPYATDGYAAGRYEAGGHARKFFQRMTEAELIEWLKPPIVVAQPVLWVAPAGRSC